MHLNRLFICLIMTLSAFTGAFAGSLPPSKGKPILTISGNIENTNNGATAEFDRASLEAIGLKTVQTANPWFDGRTSFEGIPLQRLMTLVGAKGQSVMAVALNDYVTTIPITDFMKFNVILALKREGNYMAVRDKGPLFIIYPYDSDPQLQSQTYYARSAWQVAKLIVE